MRHPTIPDIHPARSVADSSAAGRPPHNRCRQIYAQADQDGARRRADAPQEARKGQGRPAAVEEVPRGLHLRHGMLPRVVGRVRAGRLGGLGSMARVDDAKVRVTIKDKRAMPFV